MRITRPARYEDVPRERATMAVRRFRAPQGWPFVWHYHAEAELTWVTRGRGMRFVGDAVEPFAAGDLVLVAGNVPHAWQSASASASLVAQFDAAAWDASLAAVAELASVRALLARAGRGVRLKGGRAHDRVVARLGDAARAPTAALRSVALLGALAEFAGASATVELSGRAWRDTLDPAADRALRRVLDQLHAGVARGHVSQRALAASVDLTPAQFSRFFRRHVGKTYQRYVTDWRVGLACRALLESDDPITAVALESGFENLSNFNRRFRQAKGMTPRAYRRLREA